MKIDEAVEQRVRDTLHWVVKQNADKFDKALRGFPDEKSRLHALELLARVNAHAATDVFGHRPSPDEIRALADKIARSEAWSVAPPTEIATFLDAVLEGRPLAEALPADSVVFLSFIVAGNLLSSQPMPEGKWWFDYLDRIEATIEAGS
ncbi:hypothetical protein [Micromonospora endophytica]|uniref:Uncharacterized protein n=1 Tax=Micromonospora endophytica TaxID=515350 RepID=A0A2W2BKA3_9ACTN|nr:hypothetical protein [Micromonospora endophytica]PZF85700.1 hypothetical protein C1I93_28375 [Micromonospora endophytica]RIW39744.1 hypothetical protein D3H59_30225 [Micromonospora endophytica]BCJ60347.1 hypothetical protein Jiend_37690 [Micromonospora endophytica]